MYSRFSFLEKETETMSKEQRQLILAVLVFLFVIFVWIIVPLIANAEPYETTRMYVTASLLNGRATPSKKATVEARFDRGDDVETLGWSKNHHWIEVIGGETGTVWVWWEYLTERTDEFYVWNNYGSKVKIRSEPFGRVIGYLKNDGELIIDRVIFGWGHSKQGWVNLEYLTEED